MKEIFRKEGILQVLGVLAILSLLSYFLLFTPKLREVHHLQAEVALKETETANSLRMWGAMARTAGDENRRWEHLVQEWREKVPDTPETDRLMAEIGREAVNHNLKGFRLTIPGDVKAEKSGVAEGPGASTELPEREKSKAFGELRFQLSFFSTYRDMAGFVEKVPRMKRLLAIQALTVREKDGEMETTLELTAFHRMAK